MGMLMRGPRPPLARPPLTVPPAAIPLSALEARYRKVLLEEPIMAWVLRHAGWLVTRFPIREDGRTAYFLLKRQSYRGEVLDLGEVCWSRDPSPVADQHKHDRRWSSGVRERGTLRSFGRRSNALRNSVAVVWNVLRGRRSVQLASLQTPLLQS